MRDEFGQGSRQGGLPKQNDPGKTFLLDGSHPTFGKCIQIRAARGQFHDVDSLRGQHLIKGGAEFGVAVVQQITTGAQGASGLVNRIASHLSDPGLGGVTGDARDSDAAALQVEEEQHVIGNEAAPG